MKRKKYSPLKQKNKKGHPFLGRLSAIARFPYPRFLPRLIGLFFLVLAGMLLIEWITECGRSLKCFTVHSENVRCLSRPKWLAASNRITSEVVGGVQANLSRFPKGQIFDSDLEQALINHPSSFSPWIAGVESFERIYPSRYRVRLKLRRPVAIFSEDNRSFFIDESGVVITSVDHLDRGKITSSLPLITGYGHAAPIRDGCLTRNRSLLEGAAVAKEIEALSGFDLTAELRISEIDVSQFGTGRPEGVTLFTGENVRILWGRSARNREFRGIDPSPEEKTSKLLEVLEKHPHFEGVRQVTLTFKGAQTTFTPSASEDEV
ncbi:MAG: hypothetical protein KJ645_04395 [Planctomycetes bacterium]|nr:hypothetical protein [Planctomycetota bacterium]